MGLPRLCLVLMIPAAAFAQSIVDPEHLAAARAAFDRSTGESQLRCQVSSTRPALDFRFRFQTGYTVNVPLGQFHGESNRLTTLVRVTPEGGEPAYLTRTDLLPEVPETNVNGEVVGGFVVGEGTYGVEAMVQDDLHRVCRAKWHFQAKRTGSERDLRPTTAPVTVSEASAGSSPSTESAHGMKIGRLTVLLHAASHSPNAPKLGAGDVQLLLDTLASLLEQMPAQAVRLVVFNLDQHAVLLRKDGFTADALDEVSSALNQVQLAVVDYRSMQRGGKTGDALKDLLETELHAAKAPDAVIVMGPKTRSPVETAESLDARQSGPPLFYLQFRPAGQLGGMPPQVEERPRGGPGFGRGGGRGGGGGRLVTPDFPDGIGQLLSRLKGETIPIWTPHEFADAIRRMAGRIPASVSAAPSVPLPAAAAPARPPRSLPIASSPGPAPPTLAVRREPAAEEHPGEENEDPTDVLMRLRDQVLQHARRIPNHTCVETVERDRLEPQAGRLTKSCDAVLAGRKLRQFAMLRLESTDRLRLDVKLTTDREIYSWAGANRFEEGEIDELVPEGAMGTGPFAALLVGLFESRDPSFVFEGDTDIEGHRLLEYSFSVPKERSHYRIKGQATWLITGYTGRLLVDPRTAGLVELGVRTEELPAETSMCELDTTLAYGMVPLDGVDYLLPTSTRQRFVGRDGSESENRLDFAACREYRGDSNVLFGDSAAGEADTAREGLPKSLPPGLPVVVDLVTPVRSGQAAAGDRIEGRLAKAIRDERQKETFAPEGAKVFGRLMRAEVRHSAPAEFTVALRWETLVIDGTEIALRLAPVRRAPPVPKINGFGGLRQRGVPIELPLPGEERYGVYHFPGEYGAVESGFRTEWLTDRH